MFTIGWLEIALLPGIYPCQMYYVGREKKLWKVQLDVKLKTRFDPLSGLVTHPAIHQIKLPVSTWQLNQKY